MNTPAIVGGTITIPQRFRPDLRHSTNDPSMVSLLPIVTSEQFDTALENTAAAIRDGFPVAVPTETVYGLAADATNAEAVSRIYEIKQRPRTNPLIVHVSSRAMAKHYADAWSPESDRLAHRFWPGPLTLVVPRGPSIPDVVTAGGPTVALRWPDHQFMQALVDRLDRPLAAPSANPANALSPTTAAHVAKSLGDRVRLIVDGGTCRVGIESTVVDMTSTPPRLLRPGVLSSRELGITNDLMPTPVDSHLPARSPGQVHRHYAPNARVVLVDSAQTAIDHSVGKASFHFIVLSPWKTPEPTTRMPDEPHAYAKRLYQLLHELDDRGTHVVIVERPPNAPEWHGVLDRLTRASSP